MFAPTPSRSTDARPQGPRCRGDRIASYPMVARDYLLLPHGGPVGRGYGPVVIAREPATLDSLRGKSVAVPGPDDRLPRPRLWSPSFVRCSCQFSLRPRISAAREGEVDAALLIHEGRLTYEGEGFARVVEIGRAGRAHRRLPLPSAETLRRGLTSNHRRSVGPLREGIATVSRTETS